MANEASSNRLMKVWYSLNECIDSVKVASDSDMSELRSAIIAKNPPLQSFSPGTIEISAGTECINPRFKIVDLNMSENDTLVVVPPPLLPSQRRTDHDVEQTQTPGSRSNPSRAALQKLIETINATNCEIKWCGDGANWQNRIPESEVCTEDFMRLLVRSLNDSMEQISSGSELSGLDFRHLRTQSETAFQQGHLQQHFFNVEAAKALDLSKNTADGPFFKPATTVDGDHVVSAKTGKPDGTSIVVPMDLEIKSDKTDSNKLAAIDYEVLDQAIERVSMRMRNPGFLKMAFAFAVTGRSAWYLFVERLEPMNKPILWVDRIRHCDVGELWMRVTKFANKNEFFFFADGGAAICDVINKIGATPWCCRVKTLAKSQSFVYGVTVPRIYQSDGKSFVGVAVKGESITYAVKIIRDNATYKTESEALQKIAAKAGPDSTFYALGCVPSGSGEVTRFPAISQWDTGCHYAMSETYWWDRSPQTEEGMGGAIIMRRGEVTARDVFAADCALPKRVCSDLVNSLQLAHSAGVLQCDLRRSNFVRFGDLWQVIDYSLSATVDSGIVYQMGPGAQADCAGNNVKTLYKEKKEVQWTKDDDYQMFIANIL